MKMTTLSLKVKCPSMLLSAYNGKSNGRHISATPVFRILPTSFSSPGGVQTTMHQLCPEEHFAEACQSLDTRIDKRNPTLPNFTIRATRRNEPKGVDFWPTRQVSLVKLRNQSKLHFHVGYHTHEGSRRTMQSKRVQNLQAVHTTTEAIAVLKNRLLQGLSIHSYMYVEVLKLCSKEKNLAALKDVHHDCIMKTTTGMEQNKYVANSLMSAYIRCGRLQDAHRVFLELVEKNVCSWNIMIGGYAHHNRAKDSMEVFNQMCQELGHGVRPDEITYLSLLKACVSSRNFNSASTLKWGKEIHAHIRSHDGGCSVESDVRVGTALLQMYAKCGCITEARQVFDKLKNRDVISWNIMIGAYAEVSGEEAYNLFLQMNQEGLIKPDAVTYMSILRACAAARQVMSSIIHSWVKDIHSHVLESSGLESDLRVGNALVHSYSKCGRIDDAREVFDRMEDRNVITWNTMIGGLAQHGCGREAYELFLQMQRPDQPGSSCVPDETTYVSILNPSCASEEGSGTLEWVKKVHRNIQEVSGYLESDLRVGNALVHMYAKSGSIDDAREVFDRMEESRDVITWTVMIGAYAETGCGGEAYSLLLRMKREGFRPNGATYVSILNPSCASCTGVLEWVKKLHSHILESPGFESDLRVGNALVHMYARCGSIYDARNVFERMKERDVITWNVMIGELAHGFARQAYELFLQMQLDGLKPNAITYVSILNASASEGILEWVKDVHRCVLESPELESDVRVGNALIHSYSKCGRIDDARQVFERMEDSRDVVTWNSMIGGLAAQHGCERESYDLFLRMRGLGSIKPNATTFVSILNACANVGGLRWVKEIHSHVLESSSTSGGLESDLRVGNALVHMYAKSGSIDDSRNLFDRMEHRDVITWNTMIGGLAQHGCGSEALEIFKKMNRKGMVKPDGYSFVAVLSACSHSGLLDEGRSIFLSMSQDYGIEPTVVHCNCMVDLLGRAGKLEEAKVFIDNMPLQPNEATWGALLAACRTHRNVKLAEFAARERVKLDPKNAATYVLLSKTYAAAGKWEEMAFVHALMHERGMRRTELGHSWIEVDNKIHDFVVGDTFHPEAREVYAELHKLTQRIKAEGYIPEKHNLPNSTHKGTEQLAQVCTHSERLAIAYGLLRTPRGEPIRIYKNLRVCSDCHTATKFISKSTGREIVARDANRFHHFKDGVCSCDDYW